MRLTVLSRARGCLDLVCDEVFKMHRDSSNAFGITLTVLAVVLTVGAIWFGLTR